MSESIIKWSPYSILVSTPNGLIRKICPFGVQHTNIETSTRNEVTRVSETENGQLMFEINGKWLEHSNWRIL